MQGENEVLKKKIVKDFRTRKLKPYDALRQALQVDYLKLGLIALLLIAATARANPVEAASLRLAWKDNSTNETGFKIQRLIGGTFTQIGTVGANVTSYTHSSLTVGTTYCYRVQAFNSAGESAPSNQACANATDSATTTVLVSGGGSSSTSTSSSVSSSSSTLTSYSANRWIDYRVTLKMRSKDDDSIGVMFRYVDNRNYYRFSWNQQDGYRRLEKRVNGTFKTLIKDAVPYTRYQAYQLEIIAQGTSLEVKIDGSQIFSVTDSSFDKGTIALYSWYNQGSTFDDVLVEDLATGAVLLRDDFNDGNFTGWTIIDEGTEQGPSVWSAKSGALVQSSNIGSDTSNKLGTFALYTKRNWADYRVTLKMKSTDNDSIGVMFRYVDNRNYYRFSWDKQRSFRRLEKLQNGVRTVLDGDAVPYVTGQTYQLEIVARGTTLEVWIDGTLVFSAIDSSFESGTIALYSWLNQGSVFNDILVEDLSTGTVLLWDDFNDGNFTGWTIIDEGTAYDPGMWSAASGVLVQSSNIGSDTDNKLGTFLLYTKRN